MQIPNSFFRKILWIIGLILIVAGVYSFYIRFETLKHGLRQTGYETETIGGE